MRLRGHWIVAALLVSALGACRPSTPADQNAAEAPEAAAAVSEPESAPRTRLLDDLGDLHHPITTGSELAQRYFDQGLVLTFGFNHEAAIDAFREATRLDPQCAMCFWGIALAYGPNINAPMGPEAAQEAWAALREARRLAPGASDAERAYIEALGARYAADPAADRAALDRAYAEAMRALYHAHPDDLDAATLFAEALMDLISSRCSSAIPSTPAPTTTSSTRSRSSTPPAPRRPRTGSSPSRRTRDTSCTCPPTSTGGSAATRMPFP
jgi:hypothetical protein